MCTVIKKFSNLAARISFCQISCANIFPRKGFSDFPFLFLFVLLRKKKFLKKRLSSSSFLDVVKKKRTMHNSYHEAQIQYHR